GAVLFHRTELLVLAAPFLVWCALGVVRRPAGGEMDTRERVSTKRLAVGQVADYRIESSDDAILALHLPRPARCDVEPGVGATVGRSTAAIQVRPQRWGRQVL